METFFDTDKILSRGQLTLELIRKAWLEMGKKAGQPQLRPRFPPAAAPRPGPRGGVDLRGGLQGHRGEIPPRSAPLAVPQVLRVLPKLHQRYQHLRRDGRAGLRMPWVQLRRIPLAHRTGECDGGLVGNGHEPPGEIPDPQLRRRSYAWISNLGNLSIWTCCKGEEDCRYGMGSQ